LTELSERDDRVTVRIDGDERDLDQATVTTLHRAAQEAVTNARKHGDATVVRIAVTFGADGTRLVVTDDGRGFDLTAHRTGSACWACASEQRWPAASAQWTVDRVRARRSR
ncbi:sensor histidine kinase, partial [Lentzea indica]|uniref:sensor histidine kinase n=1 Tax=Lentzea indica TaxID=2604800 RepID=UPI00165ED919